MTTQTYDDLSPEDKANVDAAVEELKRRELLSKFTVDNVPSYIAAVIFTIAAWPWSGYVTSTIWEWFAVGQFGFRSITMVQAMAAGMLVACFSWSYARTPELFKLQSPDTSALERKWFTVVYMWLTPTMLLFWAWVLRFFL
jgi:hypothetical protein